MEESAAFFIKSQDFQIEKLMKQLEAYRKINAVGIENLKNVYRSHEEVSEKMKEKHKEIQQELEVIFKKVEEYEAAMDRVEKVTENSEKDLRALEEYVFSIKAKN